ncbi:MAG: hypothetical protein ACOC6G_03865 [Thermoproteota archaeon]
MPRKTSKHIVEEVKKISIHTIHLSKRAEKKLVKISNLEGKSWSQTLNELIMKYQTLQQRLDDFSI